MLLQPHETRSGLGIVQRNDWLMVRTGCCGESLYWSSNISGWACSACGKGGWVPASMDTSPKLEIIDSGDWGSWTYEYMEKIHSFVALWSGLDPKDFDLSYEDWT